MRTKRFLTIVIAAVFLISFAAMNAGAEKVLKVGLMGPFTGPAAESGQNIKNSLLMRLEEAGGGKDIWENLALSSIGGLASSTILIISAIPAIYWICSRLGWQMARLGGRLRRHAPEPTAQPDPEIV